MRDLISALRRFEAANSIEISELPLVEQQSAAEDVLLLFGYKWVVISTCLEHENPVDAMLTDEGYRKRTQLLGITIPWPK